MTLYHRTNSKSTKSAAVRARQSDARTNDLKLKRLIVALKALAIKRIRGAELAGMLRESAVSLEELDRSIRSSDDGLLRSSLFRGYRFSRQALAHARSEIIGINERAPVLRRDNSRSGSTRSFMSFANARHFEPIPISAELRPVERAYFALPMTLYEDEIAEIAYKLVSEFAETIEDARTLFIDGFHWRGSCESILKTCHALFCLAPSGTISAGMLAEAAYMHSLGRPVHLLTSWPGSEPKFEHGGTIVQYANWDWQRTAFYRPPYHREPDYYPDEPWDDEG